MARTKPGWHWDDDWRKVKYLEWLLTPPADREPRTKTQLAELFQVTTRTLSDWSETAEFRDEWQRRVTAIVGDPSRGQRIMDTLYVAATDPKNRTQVQAAKLYSGGDERDQTFGRDHGQASDRAFR